MIDDTPRVSVCQKTPELERLWQIAGAQKPVPRERLILNGELLQVLGDAFLRENYRTRQYQEIAIKLEKLEAYAGRSWSVPGIISFWESQRIENIYTGKVPLIVCDENATV